MSVKFLSMEATNNTNKGNNMETLTDNEKSFTLQTINNWVNSVIIGTEKEIIEHFDYELNSHKEYLPSLNTSPKNLKELLISMRAIAKYNADFSKWELTETPIG